MVGVTPLNTKEIQVTKQLKRLVQNGPDFLKEPPKKRFKKQKNLQTSSKECHLDPWGNNVGPPFSPCPLLPQRQKINKYHPSTESDMMAQSEKVKKKIVLPKWMFSWRPHSITTTFGETLMVGVMSVFPINGFWTLKH